MDVRLICPAYELEIIISVQVLVLQVLRVPQLLQLLRVRRVRRVRRVPQVPAEQRVLQL
jgi:hypothetical protein